jgi:hypothetical protein
MTVVDTVFKALAPRPRSCRGHHADLLTSPFRHQSTPGILHRQLGPLGGGSYGDRAASGPARRM